MSDPVRTLFVRALAQELAHEHGQEPNLDYMPCCECFALEGEACKPWCPSLVPKKAKGKRSS